MCISSEYETNADFGAQKDLRYVSNCSSLDAGPRSERKAEINGDHRLV